MLPIVGIIIIAIGLFAYVLNFSMSVDNDYILRKNEDSIKSLYGQLILKTQDLAETTANAMMLSEELRAAALKQDHQALARILVNLFETLKQVALINKLYIYDSTGKVLVRAHVTTSYGDKVNRKSYLEAEQTKKTAMAIEGDGSGDFTVRTVVPWFYNGKIIAFIEISKKISDIAQDLAAVVDSPFILTTSKKDIEQDKYLKFIEQTHAKNEWSVFENEVPVYTSGFIDMKPLMKLDFSKDEDSHAEGGFQYGRIAFRDTSGKKIANILLKIDQRDKLRIYKESVKAATIAGIILIIMTYQYLQFVGRRLVEQGRQMGILSKLAAVGESSATLAHELANQIMVIQAQIRKIKREVNDKVSPALFEPIDKVLTHVVLVLDTHRKSARSEEGQAKVAVKVEDIINDLTGLCKVDLKGHEIELKLSIEANSSIVLAHQTKIVQVLLNLVNNARDAIDKLEEKWIEVRVTESKESVDFSIINSGNPIPPEIRKKLFIQFFTSKSADKGTGLGLHISRKIAEEHGGTLTLDEHFPHTRFVLRLPKEIS